MSMMGSAPLSTETSGSSCRSSGAPSANSIASFARRIAAVATLSVRVTPVSYTHLPSPRDRSLS
eukprot:7339922-Pyramimonas_sp.AAC.1